MKFVQRFSILLFLLVGLTLKAESESRWRGIFNEYSIPAHIQFGTVRGSGKIVMTRFSTIFKLVAPMTLAGVSLISSPQLGVIPTTLGFLGLFVPTFYGIDQVKSVSESYYQEEEFILKVPKMNWVDSAKFRRALLGEPLIFQTNGKFITGKVQEIYIYSTNNQTGDEQNVAIDFVFKNGDSTQRVPLQNVKRPSFWSDCGAILSKLFIKKMRT